VPFENIYMLDKYGSGKQLANHSNNRLWSYHIPLFLLVQLALGSQAMVWRRHKKNNSPKPWERRSADNPQLTSPL